jgi:hypothetical protein
MTTPLANEVLDPESCSLGDWVRVSTVPNWQERDGLRSFQRRSAPQSSKRYLFARVEIQSGRSRVRGWKRIE